MAKTKLALIATALALVAWVGMSAATAQDGPSIGLDYGDLLEGPGEVQVTVTGSGWSVASVFVLACNVPEDSNAFAVNNNADTECTQASGNLDMGSLTPATVVDGGFEVTLTVDVPAQGVVIVAGDAGQTEAASAFISIGLISPAPDADDMGDDDMGDDMLPETGSNSAPLAIVALAAVLAGAMVLGLSRQLRTQ